MAEIGEYKIKRPQYIMFLDKDDTVNLDDKQLNNIFNLVTTMGGMVIFVTGRTVGDIESDLKKRKIKVPEIIAGDNGGNIYYTRNGTYLVKKLLNHEKVMTIADEFRKNGGNQDYIRFTNGNIYVSNQNEIKKYYKENENVIFCDDIYQTMQQTEDITKMTLAGPKKLIQQIAEFVKELDFWTDMDSTKFPKKEYKNFRLDISQKNINKGEAVKWIVAHLKPKYGYVCIGNGYNDIPMFKVAMDDGMIAAIVGNASPELKKEMLQYFQNQKKGEWMELPKDKDLANKFILKMAKEFQTYIKSEERKRMQREKRLPNIPRVKVKEIEQRNMSRGTGLQGKNRDR